MMAIMNPDAGKMARQVAGQRAVRPAGSTTAEAYLRSALTALSHVRAVLDRQCVQDNGALQAGARGCRPVTVPDVTVTFLAPNAGATGAIGIVGFQGSSAYLEPLIRICSGWIIVLR